MKSVAQAIPSSRTTIAKAARPTDSTRLWNNAIRSKKMTLDSMIRSNTAAVSAVVEYIAGSANFTNACTIITCIINDRSAKMRWKLTYIVIQPKCSL